MSKSKGNVVSPFEVMDKFGADAARWYFYTINSPEDYKLFSMKDVEQRLKGFMITLDNCVRFYELYGKGSETFSHGSEADNLLDKWILSRLNGLMEEATFELDEYDPMSAARAVEKFVIDDLSNWWLRRSRKRKEALGLLRFLLLELAKVIAPFMPFIAEDIHHRLRGNRQLPISNYQFPITESVHLADWPKINKKLIDKELEKQMEEIRSIVTIGLAMRKEKQIKVRQPLQQLSSSILAGIKLNPGLEDLIKDEVNVKVVVPGPDGLDTQLTRPLIYEGYARELMRQIQDMRKEAGYRLDDKVFGQWHSDDKEVSEAIQKWSGEIKNDVLLSELLNGPYDGKAYDVEKEFEVAPQKKIWFGIKK